MSLSTKALIEEAREYVSVNRLTNPDAQMILLLTDALSDGLKDSERLDWLEQAGHGVARHAEYAAAGDHRKASFYAMQGETSREAIDLARLSHQERKE